MAKKEIIEDNHYIGEFDGVPKVIYPKKQYQTDPVTGLTVKGKKMKATLTIEESND